MSNEDDAGSPLWDQLFDACLGSDKSTAACAAFKATPANAACAACVLTSSTATRLGPIVDYGQLVGANEAGCIEVTAHDEPCAKAVQALGDCELAACQANCPVSDLNSLAAREDCAADADATGCLPYDQAVTTLCGAAEADGGAASSCLDGDFKDFFDAVVPLFCAQAGAGALDAGASTPDGSIATRPGDGGLEAGPPTVASSNDAGPL